MKKTFRLMLAAFAIVAAASCAQELDDPNAIPQEDVELVPMTITVGGETKTTVGDDDKTLNWCEDDVIAVFDKTGTAREFKIAEGSCNGKTATFEGLVAAGSTDFTAVYPYSAAVSVSAEGVITATAADAQVLDGGNLADGATLSVAQFKKGDAAFTFRTAIGYLRVDVDKDDVTSIIVNGVNVAGQATFNAAGELQAVKEGKGQVTLTPAGETFAKGSYYVTLLPGTTPANQFDITFVRTATTGAVMTATSEVTIPRNAGFFVAETRLTESFLIKDAASLKTFLSNAPEYTTGQLATIVNDIDLTGETIASASSFKGTLDGRGHSIKNWTSDATPLFTTFAGTVKNIVIDESCQLTPATDGGKFGFITNDIGRFGRLENCTNNADITLNVETVGQLYFGSLAGVSYGTISGCTNNGDITFVVSGNVTENGCVGGIAGYVNVSDQYKEKGEGYDIAFENCVNNGNLSHTVNGTVKYLTFGGIAGGTSYAAIASESFRGTAKNCVNTGNLSYTFMNGGSLEDNAGSAGSGNYTNIGGVFGYWAGNIENCTNGVQGDATKGGVSLVFPTSDASACASRPAVGGVCGFVLQNMSGCNNFGKVYMKGSAAGGGTGNAGNGLTGEVTAGGIVAQIGPASNAADYKLSNCHNHGEVDIRAWMAAGNGTGFDLGGAVGYCGIPVENVSNNGKVNIESKGAFVRAGGVIGKAAYAASNLTNNGEVTFKGIRTSGTKQIGSELHFGGVVGSYSVSLTDSKNARNMTVTIESSDNAHAQALIGGVVGGKSSGILDKVYNEAAVTVNQNAVNSVVFGGVASWITGSVKITEAKNTGEISFNTVQMTGQLWCGGIAGYMDGDATMSGCTNDGPVSVVAQTSLTGQSFFGGVLGARADKNVTFNECVNKKTLTVKIPSSGTNSGFYYFGGVVGANKGHTYSNCANYGDIIYEGAAKIRIGGIASYTNKVATGVVSCNITAKCTGYDYSEIGGVISYTSGSEVTGAKFEGTIDTSNSTKKVYTGGIIGKMAGEGQKYNGCMFKGSLIGAEGNNVPGLYAGGLQNNAKTNVFGNTTKCVVAKGSSINGVEVTTLTKENLVSQASNDGTYTSSATLTNIVIE